MPIWPDNYSTQPGFALSQHIQSYRSLGAINCTWFSTL